MKVGTKMETNKVVSTPLFPRMDNPKLRRKRTPRPAVDHRSGTRVLAKGVNQPQKARRTHIHGARKKHEKCDVHFVLLLSHATSHWYLLDDGCVDHEYHCEEHEEHKFLKKRDHDEHEVDLMEVMYDADVNPKTIGIVMEAVRKKKGKTGQYLSKSIQNASAKYREEMQILQGMSKDWSVARKCIWELAR